MMPAQSELDQIPPLSVRWWPSKWSSGTRRLRLGEGGRHGGVGDRQREGQVGDQLLQRVERWSAVRHLMQVAPLAFVAVGGRPAERQTLSGGADGRRRGSGLHVGRGE